MLAVEASATARSGWAAQARGRSLTTDVAPLEGPAPKLSQLAYRRFKEALFQRRIRSGLIVSQAELVAITGVPISPLREAMQVLEAEGMIRILPRSGIQIMKPDLALVRNAFQLRQILEIPAVRHAAEAMPRDALEALEVQHRALLDRTPDLEVTPEVAEETHEADDGFHLKIIGSMANPLLERTYRQAQDHIRVIRLDQLHMPSAAAIVRAMQEHLTIIRACRARDPDAAQAALELHFAKAIQRALGL
jgi:DNA-binding GntR family transcriptional regulator